MRRYTLRLGGFVSLHAPLDGGELMTKLLTFAGNRLTVNYATSVMGSLRVAIHDVDGNPLPGFSLADADELFGDSVHQTVSWKDQTDVGSLHGKPIRLRFQLRYGDVYAFQFTEQ